MDKEILYTTQKHFCQTQISNLYGANGWTSYLQNVIELQRAIGASLSVISAWSGDKLVGLVRAVGDGYIILYIQDILVLPEYQRQGIGSELMRRMLEQYQTVSHKVLLTDQSEKTAAFYESMAFKQVTDYNCMAYMQYNRKD